MTADILGAAVRLFGEEGYDHVSMRQLAALAGCSPANLYHHYRSKYQIFVTLIEQAMQLHLAGLETALQTSADPVEQLRSVFVHHLRLHMERPEVRLLSRDFHPLRGEELGRFLAERDRYEEGVREIVARGIAAGRLNPIDPKLAVIASLTACTGVDSWYRPGGELSPAEVARRIADFLLAGFGVAVGPTSSPLPPLAAEPLPR
jgi:AcrR family transcriptional regulator